jgi:hypothetical protein
VSNSVADILPETALGSIGTLLSGAVLLRLLQWLATFVCTRLDLRHDRLSQREKALEAKIEKRLEEQDVKIEEQQQEIGRQHRAIGVLAHEVHRYNPESPAFQAVSKILGTAIPIIPTDASFEAVVAKLDEIP